MYLIQSVRIGRKKKEKRSLPLSTWKILSGICTPGALKEWTEVPSFGVDNFYNDDFLFLRIAASTMTFGIDKKLGVAHAR